MVAKDAVMYIVAPDAVSLWSGDEGNEAQPKHSTRDKELIQSVFCSHTILHGVKGVALSSSFSSSSLFSIFSSCLPPSLAPGPHKSAQVRPDGYGVSSRPST